MQTAVIIITILGFTEPRQVIVAAAHSPPNTSLANRGALGVLDVLGGKITAKTVQSGHLLGDLAHDPARPTRTDDRR